MIIIEYIFLFYIINTLRFLKTNPKWQSFKSNQTHIVYQIHCKNCGGVYIGQTLQYLSLRINGQKYSKNITALEKYENSKHTFDFENTKILDK